MKNYYILKCDDTHIATFDKEPNAYESRETLRQNSEYEGYIHIETHTVFESLNEWVELSK